MIDRQQAQETSFAKWNILSNDFKILFETINDPCGFCTYILERNEGKIRGKCKLCRIHFPKVASLCTEMVDFFSTKHNEIENMIYDIKQTIQNVDVEINNASK